MDFAIGGIAAAGASIFSNPFDVLKTRMQLQGELRARGHHTVYYKNVLHAAYVVAKTEGIRGLQRGLGTAMIMHTVRNSVRLGSYQWLSDRGFICDEKGKTIFYRSFLASAMTGAAGAFCGSPLFLIKTQLQSQAANTIAVGHQHGHAGLVHAVKRIYSQHGIQGLWRGADAVMLRAVAGSSAQISSFAKTKDFLREFEVFKHSTFLTAFAASIVGGVFQTLVIAPFDIVSIRLYNQATDAQGRGLLYKGIADCFIKIYKCEGIPGLYKGIGANYMRLAPHSALCLIFWDVLKDLQKKYLSNEIGTRHVL
ncbi:solute carrier family 25 member 35-like [Tribolium madens]|uniref:solute carrier family 25 member 35-like n=1 Tax=Tribolium madens TaxID=41895 RepID=UPI001CF73B02|nr:solute carrier family 25 member 35-like [Tribolium madens]